MKPLLTADGTGVLMEGWLNIRDDKVFVDERPLHLAFDQFDGYMVTVQLHRANGAEKARIDTKIQALVEALEKLGYPVIGSCEGHLEIRYWGEYVRYPYVSFLYGENSKAKLVDLLPTGWEVTSLNSEVLMVRPSREATNESELEDLQREALGFAEAINNSLAGLAG